jgi:hypothetical protein
MVRRYHVDRVGRTVDQYGLVVEFDEQEHKRRGEEMVDRKTGAIKEPHPYRKPPVRRKGAKTTNG